MLMIKLLQCAERIIIFSDFQYPGNVQYINISFSSACKSLFLPYNGWKIKHWGKVWWNNHDFYSRSYFIIYIHYKLLRWYNTTTTNYYYYYYYYFVRFANDAFIYLYCLPL